MSLALKFLRLPPLRTRGVRSFAIRYSQPEVLYPPSAYIPEEDIKSLSEIIAENEYKDPSIHYRVNIGYHQPRNRKKDTLTERIAIRKELKKDVEVERATRARTHKVPLDKVYENWESTVGPGQLKDAAEYYGIYESLFGDAYFIPYLPLSITFDYPGSEETVSRVYMGNLIKPSEAASTPHVNYPVKNDGDLYTLVMTCPDNHFSEESGEYLHWAVGNIPGNDVSKGQELINYMQPFPARGLGYCRYIFVLYKQEKVIDFSKWKRESPCNNLGARSFKTCDFYRELQDEMTPIGLRFFQSDWDINVVDFYQNVLDMKEPSFEYDFTPLEKPPQEWFPKLQPFNHYLDQYKDPKTLQEELLVEKLKERHPFQPPPKALKYPLAVPFPPGLASWQREDLRQKRMKEGKYKFM